MAEAAATSGGKSAAKSGANGCTTKSEPPHGSKKEGRRQNLVELIDIVPVSVEITGVEIELAAGVTNSI